jgi:hypothetical protein
MERDHYRMLPPLALFLLLAFTGLCAANTNTNLTVAYTAYRFQPDEGWRTTAQTNSGATALQGRTWRFDFSQGASFLGLTLPDRSLLTRPARFRLRASGSAKGHPVHVFLRTHFMTFHKIVGEFAGGSLPQELVFDAPPGEGWQWFGGENDGKLHGPLRLGEIRLENGGHADRGELELLEFDVEGSCPPNKLCTMDAEEVSSSARGEAFRVNIVSLAPYGLEGTLKWVIRDWNGRELKSGSRRIELAGIGNGPFVAWNSRTNGLRLWPQESHLTLHSTRYADEVPLPKLPASLRFAEAQFELDMPEQDIPRVQACWLAPVPAREDARLQPDSPFGMGIYLGRYNLEQMQDIARKARDAGAKWSREGLSWSRIEPRPGEFHWDYYDGLLDCATRNGISIYGLLSGWAPWAKAYTSEGVDQYVAFLKQVVAHYRGRIHHWEIWNEPNIFFWQGPKELYAELLKRSYAAVKEVDPTAQVLGISTSGIDFKFIAQMLELGAPFDVLTIHPYRKQLDDVRFIADLKKASEQVKLPDGTTRPVWLTEMGWTTHVPHHVLRQDFEPVTQRVQAQLLARVYLCSLVSDIRPRTFWYDFRDDGSDPFYFEHNLGTLRQDGRPKPAYLAFATLTHLLEGTKFDGPVDAGAGILAFRFRSDQPENRELFVVWNPTSDGVAQLRLPAKQVHIINTIGEAIAHETIPAADDPSTRWLRLDLKAGAPVYVTIP